MEREARRRYERKGKKGKWNGRGGREVEGKGRKSSLLFDIVIYIK